MSSKNFIWSIGSGRDFHNFRDLREQVGMRAHQAVAHRNPMVEPVIEVADPCLFLVIARHQAGSKAAITFLIAAHFFRPPRSSEMPVLQAAFVFIRARVADVLMAVRSRQRDS